MSVAVNSSEKIVAIFCRTLGNAAFMWTFSCQLLLLCIETLNYQAVSNTIFSCQC